MEQELTCKEFIEFLDDYVSDGLAAEARAEFERHLEICPPCVDYLNTYSTTIRLSRAGAAADAEKLPANVPEELLRAILAAVSQDKAKG